jgi:hypothetical protein
MVSARKCFFSKTFCDWNCNPYRSRHSAVETRRRALVHHSEPAQLRCRAAGFGFGAISVLRDVKMATFDFHIVSSG